VKDPCTHHVSYFLHIIPSGELQGQHPQVDHQIYQGQTTQKSLPDDEQLPCNGNEQLHLNGNDTVSNDHNEGKFMHIHKTAKLYGAV